MGECISKGEMAFILMGVAIPAKVRTDSGASLEPIPGEALYPAEGHVIWSVKEL